MNYPFRIRERAFEAVRAGRKKVEGRTVTSNKTPYHEMKRGDSVTFTNETTEETMVVFVLFVHHYPDVRTMLEKEGVLNVLSSGNTIEEGIALYNALPGYKESIKEYGIYAIGIKRQDER